MWGQNGKHWVTKSTFSRVKENPVKYEHHLTYSIYAYMVVAVFHKSPDQASSIDIDCQKIFNLVDCIVTVKIVLKIWLFEEFLVFTFLMCVVDSINYDRIHRNIPIKYI